MPSISRQYHPQSCSLEITAQTSPLSRWAKRPILKSVNFLLSFRGLSGQNHEPLEVRGNHEQLQLLSETVTHYVQTRLGQSLAPSPSHLLSEPEPEAKTSSNTASKLHLHPRSLVTHDLVLGPLSTNANHQTISLKASQLFDLVSALDDCTAELEVLPTSAPSQRPAIPVWASSAAVIVLMLGVSTATLQLTQQQPESKREWVTSSDKPDANSPTTSAEEAEGIATIPKDSTATKSQSPPIVASPPSITPVPETSPAAGVDQSNLERSAPRPQPSPSVIARAPQSETVAPSIPAKPKAPDPSPSTLNKPLPSQPPPPKEDVLAAQKTSKRLRAPIASAPADAKSVRPQAKISSPPPAAAPAPLAESAPTSTADTITAESGSLEADHLSGNRRIPDRSLNQFGRQAPGNPEATSVPPISVHAQNIRQYFQQRWQVPPGLTQPLQYQLLLNTNGSLKQVTPIDSTATQYLDKVPLPEVNQPFIAPLKPSQSLQVQLILKPDGTVQLLEGMAGDKAP